MSTNANHSGKMKTFIKFGTLLILSGCILLLKFTGKSDLVNHDKLLTGLNPNTTFSAQQISFHENPLVIWNTDLHPSPAADINGFLEPMGVRLLRYNLNNYCMFFNTCVVEGTLKVLNLENSFVSDDSGLRYLFYEAYKDDPVMKSVDAILCTDYLALCQLYIQFNKPLIIVATTRYYEYRLGEGFGDLRRWHLWNSELKQLAAHPRNFIGANNMYDANYMKYFTGITPVYVPSYASYVTASYNPTKPIYLMAKTRIAVIDHWFLPGLLRSLKSSGGYCPETVQRIHDLPGYYKMSDLASYQGIIHIPYQVSTMSFFEQYRMHIPLFFPSKKLLIDWDMQFWLLRDRLQPWRVRYMDTPPHDPSQHHLPSPNDNNHTEALDYWLQFADFYTFPHVQYFDSIEHLAEMLCRLTREDLDEISERMRQHSVQMKKKLTEQWTEIMLNVVKHSPNRRSRPS